MFFPHRSSSLKRSLASLAVFVLLATACGASSTTVAADGDTADGLAALAVEPVPVPLGDTTAAAAPEQGSASTAGPQYGDTVDEYSSAVRSAFRSGDHVEPEEARAPEMEAVPGHEVVDWDYFIPAGFSTDKILEDYADELDAVEAGSDEAEALYAEMRAVYDAGSINTEIDGDQVQLAGFIAPLSYEDEIITEFLLVPYFGACIHVPPPPPNQTIFVSLDKSEGIHIDDTWDAIWVAGTLSAVTAETDLATAGYTISNAVSGSYESL